MKLTFKMVMILACAAMLCWAGCGDDDDDVVGSSDNHAPVISSVVAEPDTIFDGMLSTVTVNANDADGDALTYAWDTPGSHLVSTGVAGNTIEVTNCCAVTEVVSDMVVAIVSDGNGGEVRDSIDIWIAPAP